MRTQLTISTGVFDLPTTLATVERVAHTIVRQGHDKVILFTGRAVPGTTATTMKHLTMLKGM